CLVMKSLNVESYELMWSYKVWKLIACTICEITRNSMYHSGFPILPRFQTRLSNLWHLSFLLLIMFNITSSLVL
ncbi:hypothetical protein MKW98_027432, partial [Papaver atlanticum]